MSNVIPFPILPESRVFILEDIINLRDVKDGEGVVMVRNELTFNNIHYDVGMGSGCHQKYANSFYTIPMFSVQGNKLPVAEIVEKLFSLETMPLWLFTKSPKNISLFKILLRERQEYQIEPHSYRVSSQQRILEQLPIEKKEMFENTIRRMMNDYATLRNEPVDSSYR